MTVMFLLKRIPTHKIVTYDALLAKVPEFIGDG
jgi:hypothetical protein